MPFLLGGKAVFMSLLLSFNQRMACLFLGFHLLLTNLILVSRELLKLLFGLLLRALHLCRKR